MPRIARVLVPSTPHHVVQRGHNRSAVFMRDTDYERYFATLVEWKHALGIKVYAWCLMTNHVHLVLEPGEDVAVVGRLMRRLAGRQTRYVNAQVGRCGSLWSGRYKASPIQTERYLLSCIRYVELNPVRAGMVGCPAAYRWSSYRARMCERWPDSLDADPIYLGLGTNQSERFAAYTAFVSDAVRDDELATIRRALNRNQLTGDRRFIEEVERRIGRRVESRGQGRPQRLGPATNSNEK